ncbi:MAG: hypothetical protein WED05_10105 [Candidatus Atabeyarchaeum deiterrae]
MLRTTAVEKAPFVVELKERGPPEIVELSKDEFEILANRFKNKIEAYVTPEGKCLLKARQYVGNIALPHHRIIIRPKVPNLSFFFMLLYTNGIPDFGKNESEYMREQEIFELIIERFLEDVGHLARRGISKAYVENDENLNHVSGRVLIQEDIRRNSVLRHRIFCSFSDFTSDTVENRIIKYALSYISRMPLQNSELRNKAKEIFYFFESASFVVIDSKDFPHVQYNRLNEHYRPIVNLSRLIIDNVTLNLEEIGEIPYSSFLINMDQLFQDFVFCCLRENLRDYGVRAAKEGNPPYALDLEGDMIQEPDVKISKDGIDVLVLDAKYKRLQDDDEEQADPSTQDARQIFTYCMMPVKKVPIGVLVYPMSEMQISYEKSLKHDVILACRVIDLTRKTSGDLLTECRRFVDEIRTIIEQKSLPKMFSSAAK